MRPEFTKRTKVDAWQLVQGRCQQCGARLGPGNVEYHHATECTMGGSSDLGNCIVLCKTCHRAITSKRAPVIAKSNRVRAKHIGIRRRSSFQTNRNAPFKKKMDGSVERR